MEFPIQWVVPTGLVLLVFAVYKLRKLNSERKFSEKVTNIVKWIISILIFVVLVMTFLLSLTERGLTIMVSNKYMSAWLESLLIEIAIPQWFVALVGIALIALVVASSGTAKDIPNIFEMLRIYLVVLVILSFGLVFYWWLIDLAGNLTVKNPYILDLVRVINGAN